MSRYTGYCEGYIDDGSGYLCVCDHTLDEHTDGRCDFCEYGEAL